MDFRKLSIHSWEELDTTGDIVSGYQGIFLSENEGEKSSLLIFKDEDQKLHFVIAVESVSKKDIPDPNVKGLQIELNKYRFSDLEIKQFLDLKCNLNAYISEFTEVVKEITKEIIVQRKTPLRAVSETIDAWKSFWGSQIKQILSEEEQIGLICELNVLKRLCEINPVNALNSWKGPLKEKFDFVFSDWVFEVKGTRRRGHIHTINGLDQLTPPSEKDLGVISFLATKTESADSKSLQDFIEDIGSQSLQNKAGLIERFSELLVGCGYSRFHKEEYRKTRFEIYDGKYYVVNEDFPKLTTDFLKQPISGRISEVRYTVDLENLPSENFDTFNIGNCFY